LLGLSDKERREATASKGFNASAIMFREANEGTVKAYNFSSSASITTLHSKNVSDSRSVTTEKMLAKSVFSIATSKVTSDGLEEEREEENNSDYDAGPATKPGVAIEGMQMLTRGCTQQSDDSMDKDNAPGDDVGTEEQESNHEEAAQLTKSMNAATANLNLSSWEGDQHNNNKEEFDSAINSENTINFYSDKEEGEDFLEDNLYVRQEDLTLGNDFDTALEMSSGVFDATDSNKFEEPNNFKKLLWNIAGPSPGSMIILLDLLKDDLEADHAGLSTNFDRIPMKLLEFMVLDAGEDWENQIKFIKQIIEELEQIDEAESHNKDFSWDGGTDQPSIARKTQGMLPGAHEASPTEEAAIESAMMAGRDKEGAQSLSVVPPG
jgi:hypothetical protein